MPVSFINATLGTRADVNKKLVKEVGVQLDSPRVT
jgi:hypothetical protein